MKIIDEVRVRMDIAIREYWKACTAALVVGSEIQYRYRLATRTGRILSTRQYRNEFDVLVQNDASQARYWVPETVIIRVLCPLPDAPESEAAHDAR